MKFLANENFPVTSSRLLTEFGFDIVHVGEIDAGISDDSVIKIAISQNRVILTFDRDYGELVFRKGFRPPGVIYLRIEDYLPDEPGKLINSLIRSGDYQFEGQFTVIDEGSIRQRRIL